MYRQEYDSILGKIYMSSDGDYLTGLWFKGTKGEAFCSDAFDEKDLPIFRQTKEWLDIYFKGEKPSFTPAYKIYGLTPFRKDVIDQIKKIPYGSVLTYKDIAQKIAQQRGISKMSAQAVGGAVGWNPICIIIPCHRVIGTNQSLVGYSGGIQNKVELLKLEGHDMTKFKIPKKGTAL